MTTRMMERMTMRATSPGSMVVGRGEVVVEMATMGISEKAVYSPSGIRRQGTSLISVASARAPFVASLSTVFVS
jgi:hypothetical protein